MEGTEGGQQSISDGYSAFTKMRTSGSDFVPGEIEYDHARAADESTYRCVSAQYSCSDGVCLSVPGI